MYENIDAVRDIESATSPSANLVSTFDVTPPGAAAIIITPRASSIDILNIFIRIKAMIGSRISWQIKPTRKSLGWINTLVKSLSVNPNPRPSMIRANAIGAIFVTISIFIIIGSANAVNLTDGLDA